MFILALILQICFAGPPAGLPQLSLGSPDSALFELPSSPNTRYVIDATGTARWPDVPVDPADPAATKGPDLKKDERVEVVAHQGALARVRRGTDFGWLNDSALTAVAPPKPDLELPELDLDLPDAPAGAN